MSTAEELSEILFCLLMVYMFITFSILLKTNFFIALLILIIQLGSVLIFFIFVLLTHSPRFRKTVKRNFNKLKKNIYQSSNKFYDNIFNIINYLVLYYFFIKVSFKKSPYTFFFFIFSSFFSYWYNVLQKQLTIFFPLICLKIFDIIPFKDINILLSSKTYYWSLIFTDFFFLENEVARFADILFFDNTNIYIILFIIWIIFICGIQYTSNLNIKKNN